MTLTCDNQTRALGAPKFLLLRMSLESEDQKGQTTQTCHPVLLHVHVMSWNLKMLAFPMPSPRSASKGARRCDSHVIGTLTYTRSAAYLIGGDSSLCKA
jgi:hypothetical protein